MASLNPEVASVRSPNLISDQSEQPKSAQYNATADVPTSDIIMNNLTNVIPPLAEAGDRLTKVAIDNSIYDQNDKLNREFGASDMIALNDSKVPQIPSSLEDSVKNLQRISGAYSSGAISKTTFDVKVASMASDLRAQYSSPYLRDYIDKKVQDVTGVDPQNQVRRDIFAAVEKNNESALSEEKKKQSLAADLAKNGVAVPGWEKMSYSDFINATAASQRYKDNTDRWKAARDTMDNQNAVTDQDHDREVQNSAKAIVVQNLTNVNSALGKTKAELDAQFKNISSMTGTQKAQLVARAQQFHDKVIGDTRTAISQNWTGSKVLDQKHLDDLMTPTREYMDNWLNAYLSGNEQALKYLDDNIKFLQRSDDERFLSVPDTRAAAAAFRNLGGIAGSAAMEKYLPAILKNNEMKFAKDALVDTYGTDKGKSAVENYRTLATKGVTSKQAYDAIVNVPGAIIDDARATPEDVQKSVRTLYGADNYQFVSGLPDKDKAAMYGNLYSPQRTKSMERIRDNGDINSWNMYVTSAKRMFGSTFRQAAMSMQQGSFDPSRYRVVFNANTHQFEFDQTMSQFAPRGQAVAVPSHPEVDIINSGLKTIVPIIESNGQDVNKFLTQQFQESNMTGPPGGWRQSDNLWAQLGGSYFATQQAVDLQNGRSNLGGPGISDGGNTQNIQSLQDQMDARTGILKEISEFNNLISKTEDPQLRSTYMQHVDELLQDYKNAKSNPASGTSNEFEDSGRQQNSRVPSQVGPAPAIVSPTFGGLNPRGAPNAGTPTDQQSSDARDMIDTLTGIPSFMEAVQRGDIAGAALAAATILPFPGGKAVKAGEEIAKAVKAGDVVSSTTLEGRRIANEMDASKALESKIPGNNKSGAFSDLPVDKNYSYSRMNPDGSIEKYDGLSKKQVNALSKGDTAAETVLTPEVTKLAKNVGIEIPNRELTPNEIQWFNRLQYLRKKIDTSSNAKTYHDLYTNLIKDGKRIFNQE